MAIKSTNTTIPIRNRQKNHQQTGNPTLSAIKIEESRLTPEQINKVFQTFAAKNPNPEGELYWVNEFTLLVAVVLSAQATDVGVNKRTKELFAIVKTPQQMLKLGEDKLKQHIKTIGLYHNKAKNIIKLSDILVKQYNGNVPQTRDELTALPGVGRKTANVVLNIAFNQPALAVDTHIFRVSNRTGLARGKTPLAIEKNLLEVVPEKYLHHAHHWLILHGRYICKARNPDCANCQINKICLFDNKSV